MKLCIEELGHGKLAFYPVKSCHGTLLKNSHITQCPLLTFARIRENLLVSGFWDANELAELRKR